MKRTYPTDYIPTPCRPKGFKSEYFPLLHLGLIVILDKRDGLSTMDLIPLYVMTSDVSHRFHRKGFAANLNLVAFHRFLDGSTYVADPNINTGILTGISDTKNAD